MTAPYYDSPQSSGPAYGPVPPEKPFKLPRGITQEQWLALIHGQPATGRYDGMAAIDALMARRALGHSDVPAYPDPARLPATPPAAPAPGLAWLKEKLAGLLPQARPDTLPDSPAAWDPESVALAAVQARVKSGNGGSPNRTSSLPHLAGR